MKTDAEIATATLALQAATREDQATIEVLLTAKQYAEHYGIHVQTVYTAIRYGRHLEGRVVRPSKRAIRIAVSRGSIQRLTHA
jgi:hypothetical protein